MRQSAVEKAEPAGDAAPRQGGRAAWISLSLVLLAALAARLIELDASFWYDEVLTWRRAHMPLAGMMRLGYPLANMLAAPGLWLADAEWALRLYSVLAGVAAAAAAFALGRRWLSLGAGIAAASFIALCVSQVEYSQEARYYALLTLILALTIWVADRLAEGVRLRDAVLFVPLVLIGSLTHLFYLVYLAPVMAAVALWILLGRPVSLRKGEGVVEEPPSLKRRIAVIALLAVLTAAGLLLAGEFTERALSTYDLVQMGMEATFDASPEGDLAEAAAAESAQAHRLGLGEYAGYFHSILGGPPAWLMVVYMLVAAAGLVRLALQMPRAALVCLAFVLAPAPLFLIEAPHWYADRYFVAQALPWALLMGAGVDWIAHAAGGVLPVRAHARAAGGVLALLLLLWAIPAVQMLRGYYERHPAHDWRGVAQFIADAARPGDVLCLFEPRGKAGVMSNALDFYLERSGPRAMLFPDARVCGSIADLDAAMRSAPHSAVWTIRWEWGDAKYPASFRRQLEARLPLQRRFNGILLAGRDAPTRNLLAHGGFEDDRAGDYLRGQADFVTGSQALSGARSVRIEGDAETSSMIRLRLPDEAPITLRNASFEAWRTEQTPAGWAVSGDVRRERRGAASMLRLADGGAAWQDLGAVFAPESQIIVAFKLAGEGRAEVVLRYTHEGRAHKASAVVDAEPRPRLFKHAFEVPDGAVAALGLTVHGGAVQVDDLALTAPNPRRALNPDHPWLLSFDFRHENVLAGENPARVMRVNLGGTGPSGEALWLDLFRSRSDKESRRIVLPFWSGGLVPEGAADLTVYIGLWQCEGLLWVDNVQLERGGRPTAFVDGVRLPHDEFLAQLEGDLK